MNTLSVKSSAGSYHIHIGKESIDRLSLSLKENYAGKRAAIITDSVVAPLYADEIKNLVAASGLDAHVIVIPSGEESKCIGMLQKLYSEFCNMNLTRTDLIIALGGGVVGDLSGFAAATFLRGVPYISIPTTLLSQVDSSIGGKTAVDLPEGKNLVGAFYPPKEVFINPDFLDTLSDRVFFDGLAEVIKYGCIMDTSILDILSEHTDRTSLKPYIAELILKSLAIKKKLVEEDEHDTGSRMLLNFGHTFGHAIEKHYKYSKYTHGEAVGMGMLHITRKSEELGETEKGTSDRILNLLNTWNLPAETKDDIKDDIESTVKLDKKTSGASIRLILLRKCGESFIKKITISDVSKYI